MTAIATSTFFLPPMPEFLRAINAIERFNLNYESPFISCWSFRDYGWMVEILGIHHGPSYKTVRRRAELITIEGVKLWVAQASDAPKERRPT